MAVWEDEKSRAVMSKETREDVIRRAYPTPAHCWFNPFLEDRGAASFSVACDASPWASGCSQQVVKHILDTYSAFCVAVSTGVVVPPGAAACCPAALSCFGSGLPAAASSGPG